MATGKSVFLHHLHKNSWANFSLKILCRMYLLLVFQLLITHTSGFAPTLFFKHPISSSLHLSEPLGFSLPTTHTDPEANLELAWRSIKRPLLSISQKKGITPKHITNFATLLSDHKIMKVKFSGLKETEEGNRDESLKEVISKILGENANNVEVLRLQPSDGMILFGLEGMTEQVRSGKHRVKVKRKGWLPKPPPKKKTDNIADSVEVD